MKPIPIPSTPEGLQTLLNGPAAKPPPGVRPNFDNPETLNAACIAVVSICLVLATMAVLTRAYTKLFILRSTAYEDYMIVAAWVGQLGFTVPSVYDFTLGGGSHMWDIRLKDFFVLLYWFNVTAILYGIIVCLIKVSILLQYLRIFVPTRKGNMVLFVSIHTLIWIIVVFYTITRGIEIFICNPRKKLWNPLMPTGTCMDTAEAYQASGLFNVISDFLILLLPMAPIWRLRLPLKKKVMMIAIFATGFFACLTSIMRTYYSYRISSSPDVSRTVIIMGLWTWAEITTGLIVSCLPVIPKFFQVFGPKFYKTLASFGSSKSGSEVGLNSGSEEVKNKIEVSVQFDRRLDPYSGGNSSLESWCDSDTSRPSNRKEYSILNASRMAPPQKDPISERIEALVQGRGTRRDDLETGRSTM